MNTPRQYLIWDNAERGAWHRPGLHGYTCDINEAGRFDEATARRIVDNAGPGPDGGPDTIMMLEPTGRIALPVTLNPDERFRFAASTLDHGRLNAIIDAAEQGPSCLLCGCTENRACTIICAWVTDSDLVALGLDPMTADLCTACLPARRPTDEMVDAARAYVQRVSANWTTHPDGPDPRPTAYLHALNVMMANAASAHLRALLLVALKQEDDGRTPLSDYVIALIGQRDDEHRRSVAKSSLLTAGRALIHKLFDLLGADEQKRDQMWAEHNNIADRDYAVRAAKHGHIPAPAPATQGDPRHAAAEAAMQAVAARFKQHSTEPYGDLAIGPQRAAIIAVDTAAPILAGAPAQALDEGDLARWMVRAALNPGSIAGNRRGPSWRPDAEGYAEVQESMAEWVERAVRAVLAKGGQPHCERCCEVIRVDDAYEPPLPGIGLWEHAGVCPPRTAPNGCDDCSVEPGERHRHTGCPGNQRTIERELTRGA